MTREQLERAALLRQALDDLPNVLSGLKEDGFDDGCPMRFKIEAYEDQGESGGVSHGDTLMPVDYAMDVVEMIEKKLRAELAALGITN